MSLWLILLSDIFKFDPNFLENEEKYRQIKTEILGEDESSEEESGSDESENSEEERTCTSVFNLELIQI